VTRAVRILTPVRRGAWLIAAVAAGSLLAACSGVNQRPREEALLSAVPARLVQCAPEPHPVELPAVDAVLDSARLDRVVGDLLQADTVVSTGYVLVTLEFDEQGRSTRRSVIEHSALGPVADSIQRMLFSLRRDVDEADTTWGVRVRLDLGDRILMRTGRREFCPPVPRDRRLASAMEGYNPVGFRFRGGVGERIVHMRSLIGTTGNVETSHMERGGLQGSQLERDIALHLRQFLFTPATVDGFDTPAWVTIPVRIVDR
jgi:hypothetical protein